MKIIWINGTFGIGKTAVANAITKKINDTYLLEFDALQEKYKPTSFLDFCGERYPEARRYLIDALKNEILTLIQNVDYKYIIIPIALINDYCNQKLVNTFIGVENYHFILTASSEILYQRIKNQKNRDVDLAITYMQTATMYLIGPLRPQRYFFLKYSTCRLRLHSKGFRFQFCTDHAIIQLS